MAEPLPVGSLTPESARRLSEAEALQLLAERLWLASTRLAGAAELLAPHSGELRWARARSAQALTETDAALSDVLTVLHAVYASTMESEGAMPTLGVVTVEDSAWLWREQARGILLDFATLPKSSADLVEDLHLLSRTIRLTARAFTSVAQRAPVGPRQLELVKSPPPSPDHRRCLECGATLPYVMATPLCDECLGLGSTASVAREAVLAEDWNFGGWVKGKGWRAYLQHVTDPATTWEVFGRTREELVAAIRQRRLEPAAQEVPNVQG